MVSLPTIQNKEPFDNLGGWTLRRDLAGVPTTSGGTLRLPVTGTIDVLSALVSNFDVGGDIAIEQSLPVGERRYFRLRLEVDTQNYIEIGTYKTDIETHRRVDDVLTVPSLLVGGYNGTSMRWWRLQDEGPNVAAWTSPDGANWELRARIPNPFDLSACKAVIMWGNDRTAVATSDGIIYDLYYNPPVVAGPTVSVWNGTAEVAATVKVWDGAAEVAAGLGITE